MKRSYSQAVTDLEHAIWSEALSNKDRKPARELFKDLKHKLECVGAEVDEGDVDYARALMLEVAVRAIQFYVEAK